jgi:methionine-gamma-lyase
LPTENELSGTAEHHRPPRPSPTTIRNRKLSAQTLMLGYGFDPELSEGSLKPPIFLTSTFVFESAAAGKRFFEGVTGKRPGGAEGLIYSRFNGPTRRSSRIASRSGKTPTTRSLSRAGWRRSRPFF